MEKNHIVIATVTQFILPFIIIFGLYVFFHGKISPGGGFQAGVILASGFVLYSLVFGVNKCQKVISKKLLIFLCAGGVIIYAGVGFLSILNGLNFLDYTYLNVDKAKANMLGVSIVEFGVLLTVFSAFLLFFYFFAEGDK